MNLKEAFQAQNTFEKFFSFVTGCLDDEKNLLSTTEKHLRSNVADSQPDGKILRHVKFKRPRKFQVSNKGYLRTRISDFTIIYG